MASLLDDYVRGGGALMQFYAGNPRDVAVHPVPVRAWDAGLAAGLRDYQAALGLPARFRGDEGVIITGQQPGIFTGPMYTIYKAITAIRLAAALQEETGTPFVPIYWVGGDDHDFQEISRVHLLNKVHAPIALALQPEEGQRACSVYQLSVPQALHALADEAARQAAGSEFSEEVRGFLHESLDASANISEWHARLMARLFRDTPLVIFTPELPAARTAAIPVFEREIQNPLMSTVRLNAGGARLEAAGYGAQVVKADNACNFFVDSQGMRCRVQYVDGRFELPETGESYGEGELLDLLHRDPGRFTANVALRCIVQQHLFPARAYVAGPGELAYWGQLKDVFDGFELPMPVVYPRIRGVLTSIKTNKLLRKYDLSPADLNGPSLDLEERALRATQQDPALAVVARHAAALMASAGTMRQEIEAIGRGGKAAALLASHFELQVQQGLAHLERGILRADEGRTAAVKAQLERLILELAPERKPQERYYTIFSWLFQQGWGLVPKLSESLDHRDFSLQEVEL